MFIPYNSRQKIFRAYQQLLKQSLLLERSAKQRQSYRRARKHLQEQQQLQKLRAGLLSSD